MKYLVLVLVALVVGVLVALLARPRRRTLVLGTQLAAARNADADRAAQFPELVSPIPSRRYEDEPHGSSLVRAKENEIDRAIRSVVTDFAAASPEERVRITRSIDTDGLYRLWRFALRSAVFALRGPSAEACRDGFRAVAMIDIERIDYRDFQTPLGWLDIVAVRFHFDRDALYEEAERLAVPAAVAAIRALRDRPAESRSLRASCLADVVTSDGPSFVRDHAGSSARSDDLVERALRVLAALESTRYEVEDPEIDGPVPSFWFRRDDRIGGLLAQTQGVVTLRATLRAEFDKSFRDQQLICFIAKAQTSSDASEIAESTKGALKDGGAVVGVASGEFVCVVIGRAFRQGTPSFETPESLGILVRLLEPCLGPR